ncbi:hypothetical protein HJFPF1_05695 [Paramyrothecium foliicola]|nr:hypothetical protein HJFPF1_05695 [Paramyrothecium foliicola]
MQLSGFLVATGLFFGVATADWGLFSGTCDMGIGEGTAFDMVGAKNGDVCSGMVDWDGASGESRMNSRNPCKPAEWLRYVRDGSEYNIYRVGDPNTKVGRCFPDNTFKACAFWNYSCLYLKEYNCKSPICNSG